MKLEGDDIVVDIKEKKKADTGSTMRRALKCVSQHGKVGLYARSTQVGLASKCPNVRRRETVIEDLKQPISSKGSFCQGLEIGGMDVNGFWSSG